MKLAACPFTRCERKWKQQQSRKETEEKEVAAYSSGCDPRDRRNPRERNRRATPQQPPTEMSIILGDSIVQRIHGPSLSKKVGHRVMVNLFPGQRLKTWNPMSSLL